MELLPLVCLCLLSCSGDAVRVVVEEDSDAVLPCSPNPKVDISGQVFDWKKGSQDVFIHYSNGKTREGPDFIGRVSHFQDQLQNGNASIKIRKTKMADNGTYSCYFPDLQSQTSIIELVVGQVLRDRRDENIPGAAPKPYIHTLAHKPDWALLQCEAHGYPPLTVEWKDSAGKTLPAEEPQISKQGRYSYVTVNITVTKTDDYSCVATQKNISHQVAAVIPVHIQGAASEPSVTIVRTGDVRMLQCKVLGASPKPKVEWKDSSGNVLQAEKPKVTKSGDSYDIVLQAALTKTDTFSCVVTQEGSDSPLSAKLDAAVTGSNTGAIVGGVVGVAALIIIVLVAVIIILCRKLRNPGSTPVAAKGQPDANEGTTMIASE